MTKEALRLLKVIGIIAAAAVLVIALLIYVGVVTGSAIKENPSETGSPVISPDADDNVVSVENTVKLYFRYGSMLACETRVVQAYSNQLVEQVALKALLSGPSGNGTSFERVIDPQTTIVSVTADGDTLNVTLSSEFLRQSSNLPEGWGEDASLREEEYLRKRLAVYSVINTLTGIGNYSHVQLLIDIDKIGVGQRVTMGKLGFFDDSKQVNDLIAPMSFNQDINLNAKNTVKTVLEAIQTGDVATAFSFMAAKTQSGLSKPLYDGVASKLRQLVSQIEAFTITGEDYSKDGASAIVWVDITYKTAAKERIKKKSSPVKLRLVDQIWMLDHDILYSLFAGE